MLPSPTQLKLQLKPQARFEVIDVAQKIAREFGDLLNAYRKSLYCSFHTTAGYLEQSLCASLKYSQDHVSPFIELFQKLFPPEANYRHDQLQLRTELSEAQRQVEPKNADSHLIFISSGMKNCVTYDNKPDMPVYFIDLDGVNGDRCRCRQTTVLAFNEEKAIHKVKMAIPVSRHPIDSINLIDPRYEFFEQLKEMVRRLEIVHGRIDIALDASEKHAGLTVNEYETLLMQHDLAEVLNNPLKFVAIRGKHALAAPQLIPEKTLNYAKYDLVHIFNLLMDKFGVSETVIEKFLSIFIRLPASHYLSMKRQISLLVSEDEREGTGKIVFGKYQSPILVQWKHADKQTRYLEVSISKFA
ncbi:MAG: hypothetical protein ACE5HO_10855 [bacterium]